MKSLKASSRLSVLIKKNKKKTGTVTTIRKVCESHQAQLFHFAAKNLILLVVPASRRRIAS